MEYSVDGGMPVESLSEHEMHSAQRAAMLEHDMRKMHEHIEKRFDKLEDDVDCIEDDVKDVEMEIKRMDKEEGKAYMNVFDGGIGGGGGYGAAGAGIGAGLGGGLLGGILAGALFGGRGFGGFGGEGGRGWGAEGIVTPAQFQAGLNAVTTNAQSDQILATLGDIKGSIPYAEGQVQLSLAGVQSDLQNAVNQSQLSLLMGQNNTNNLVTTNTATILAAEQSVKDTVQDGVAALQLSIANSTYAGVTATRDAKDAVLAAINQNVIENLQRQLTVSELAGLEQRTRSHANETAINITNTLSNTQSQAQFQQQQQQILGYLQQFAPVLASVYQNSHATAANTSIIAGNSGAVVGGAQAATPTSINTLG